MFLRKYLQSDIVMNGPQVSHDVDHEYQKRLAKQKRAIFYHFFIFLERMPHCYFLQSYGLITIVLGNRCIVPSINVNNTQQFVNDPENIKC